MTHFTVLVCARSLEQVDELLAPYDENLEGDPRKDYEEGAPWEHWAYTALKADAQKALETPETIEPELHAARRLFEKLHTPPTWKDVAFVHNGRYAGEGDRMYTEELPDGQWAAYTMTTYNPDSKWDWYVIGGRWSGHFIHRKGYADQVVGRDTGWNPHAGIGSEVTKGFKPMHCDGGPKFALDFEATRDEAEATTRKWHAQWQSAVAGTPEGRPWSYFRGLAQSQPAYTIDMARDDYQLQPRTRALRGTDFQWAEDPIADYDRPLEVQIAEARDTAITCWALLTLDGEWVAPGEMGWFASSTDDEGSRAIYQDRARAYIDSLDDDVWLVCVDAHI